MTSAIRQIAILTLTAGLLSACGGGGGGGGGALAPAPAPSSGPSRVATPSSFESQEYRANYGLGQINASEAYSFGGTGRGVKIAVIDTGIDTDHPDLAGNINGASRDIVSSRNQLQDDLGHGTNVAGVVGALRNGSGVHGLAYQSSILAIRADEDANAGPLACIPECGFFLSDLLNAIDYAIAQNAKVINLSLGASASFSDAYLNKLNEAADAGIVVVAAAGNGSNANPDFPAAYATDENGRGNILSVGAVDDQELIAAYSNRAGTVQDRHLVAPGSGVITTADGGGLARVSGTSFATPAVSGAAAILFQLFPNLTPKQVVDILLDSARDLGTPGTDPIYGQGHLDIGAAIRPQGTMSVPSGTTAGDPETSAPLTETFFNANPAWASALAGSSAALLSTDKYNRGYLVDLAWLTKFSMAPGSQVVMSLNSGFNEQNGGTLNIDEKNLLGLRQISVSSTRRAGNSQTLTAYQSDRSLIASDDQKSSLTRFEFAQSGFDQLSLTGGRNVSARQLASSTPHGFAPLANNGAAEAMTAANSWGLVPEASGVAIGFQSTDFDSSLLGGSTHLDGHVTALQSKDGVSNLVEGSFGPRWVREDLAISLQAHVGQIGETNQIMGLRGSGTLALNGSSAARLTGVSGSMNLGNGMTFWGRFDRMSVDFDARSNAGADNISATAFAFGLAGRDLFAGGDNWALRISQPLRINKGSLSFHLPQGVNADNSIRYDRVKLSVKPDSREWNIEAGWQSGIWLPGGKTGRLNLNAIYAKDPGHIGNAQDEWGGMMRITLPF